MLTGWVYVVGASLGAETIKNLPAIWEAWVQSLGCEDPLHWQADS